VKSLLETFYGTGTFQRPDTSGIRGKGVDRKAQQSGGKDYPYDKPRGTMGEPAATSRDSSGHGGSHRSAMTPDGIASDDDRWNDEIDDLEEAQIDGYMTGSPIAGNIVKNPPRDGSKFGLDGDDGMEEAMGVPFNVAKTGQGTGSSGGRTMPGTGGSWSAGPIGGVWDDHMDLDDLEDKGVEETTGGIAMRTNSMYRRRPPNRPEGHDDEPEQIRNMTAYDIPDDDDTRDDIEWKGVKKSTGKFGAVGQAMKLTRMQPGMTWREGLQRVFEARSSQKRPKADFRGIYERRISRRGDK